MRSRYARRVFPKEEASDTSCIAAFDEQLDYVIGTLVRFGAPRGDLDDLLQDIFLILYRRWPELDRSRSLRPWLFGVAFRVVRAHRRLRAREVPFDNLDATDLAPDPESWAQGHEILTLLTAALDRVPPPRRAAIIMHDIEGLDVADIARKLSMSRFGVYTRLFKGRRELAEALRAMSKNEFGP